MAKVRALQERRLPHGAVASLDALCAAEQSSVEELTAALGETSAELKSRFPARPEWLTIIRAAWTAHEAAPVDADARCLCGGRPTRGHDPVRSLLGWVAPLVRWAREELADRLRDSPVDLEYRHPLLSADDDTLLSMVQQPALLELETARSAGRLCGAAPEDRFACFATALANPCTGARLLMGYPVLARELVEHVRRWIEVRHELAVRTVADLDLIRTLTGTTAKGLDAVVAVGFGAGDPHRGGRSVTILTFEDGVRVVYKPRGAAPERCFAGLVQYVNEAGLTHALRPVGVVDRQTHSWAVHVSVRPCADAEELRRFWWRQGAFLALFYVLRAYDMHMHNVIADGEFPSFFDLEVLFHAPADFEDDGAQIARKLRESVLTTLLLPQQRIAQDDEGTHQLDVSGMTGGSCPTDRETRRTVQILDAGTDRMRTVRQRMRPSRADNLPTRDGGRVDPADIEQVVGGFVDCYRILMTTKDALVSDGGPLSAFRTTEVRTVLRNTSEYTELLTASWQPSLLRDGADRDFMTSQLGDRGELRQEAFLRSEVRQLRQGDVPVFQVGVAGTALTDETGELVADFFSTSGWAAATARVAALTQEDLDAQVWCIRAAFATVMVGQDPPPLRLSSTGAGVYRPERCLDAARTIADRLLATRHDDGSGPEWATLNPLGSEHWSIGATDLSLSSGVTGIALFLAEIGAVLDEPRYRVVVEDLLGGVLDPDQEPDPEDLLGCTTGIFGDLGGLGYLLARLRVLWGPGVERRAAPWLAAAVDRGLADAVGGDVLGGAAGAALTLVTLHRTGAVEASREMLVRAGRQLLGHVPEHNRHAGFGRGDDGIAYALARVGAELDDPALIAAAVRILTLLPSPVDASAGDVSWCRGLSGTLIAATGILKLPLARAWREQLTVVQQRTTSALRSSVTGPDPVVRDDSLCHGATGLAEALMLTVDVPGGGEAMWDRSRALLAAAAERVRSDGPVCAAPTGLWVPGLRHGAAGVGHALLRAYAGDRVPQVLCPAGITSDHAL
ncbi:type 2 lanthipeptide synthetase LanM family protein [Actinoplanes regularis]|nr:type 2 lanthipeptide synthetase LanM family protein [Actinoplanes regularis]